jgi:hypothetical protein
MRHKQRIDYTLGNCTGNDCSRIYRRLCPVLVAERLTTYHLFESRIRLDEMFGGKFDGKRTVTRASQERHHRTWVLIIDIIKEGPYGVCSCALCVLHVSVSPSR